MAFLRRKWGGRILVLKATNLLVFYLSAICSLSIYLSRMYVMVQHKQNRPSAGLRRCTGLNPQPSIIPNSNTLFRHRQAKYCETFREIPIILTIKKPGGKNRSFL